MCAELPYFLFLFEQSCLISSVHDPAPIDLADSVLHLEDGKIAQPRKALAQDRPAPGSPERMGPGAPTPR